MRACLVVAAVILSWPSVASGQEVGRVRLAVFGAGSEYREQSAALAFGGSGAAGRLEIAAGRFGVSVTGSRLAFTRASTAALDAEPFALKDLDFTGRARIVSVISLEVGAYRRWIEPDRAAQSLQAGKVGLRADYRLAPGADAGLRASYLGGSKFSGGGSAKAGVALGFALSYGAKRRGVRIVVDYDFLRINRETMVGGARVAVPVQSSTARLGALLIL